MTYTYDDIVTAKDIRAGKVRKEDIIGKQGWFFDAIPADLNEVVLESMDAPGRYGVLEDVAMDESFPLRDEYDSWIYFLPEKEEPRTDTFGEIARKLNGFLYTRYITLHWWEGRSYIYGWGDRPDYNGETWLWGKARYIYRLELPEGYSPEIEPCFRADGKIDYSKCIIDFEEEASMEPADTILGAPVYLPFDLSLQEDRDALRDRWIRCRQTGSEYRISAFKHRDDYGWKAHTPQVGLRDGGQLLNNYEFLDGSPIGHREGGRKHD